MNILLSAASAEAGSSTGQLISLLVLYGLMFGALWFFMIRPQSKQQKKQAAMIATLENGDCVMTTSGFYGVVIDISEDTVIVEFGNNKNCRIPMDKNAISKVEKQNQ